MRRGENIADASRWLVLIVISTALATAVSCSRDKAAPPWKADVKEVPPLSRPEDLDVPVQQQYRQLREHLDQLLKNPHATPAELALGYGKLGMFHDVYGFADLAEACYGNAERLAPGDRRWPYYRGILALRTQPERAREAFERALALAPDDVPTLIGLGEADLALGRVADAEARLRAGLAASPDNVRALADLGATALAKKDYPEAVRLLEQATAKQPDASQIHQWLGLAYRALGDTRQAELHLAKAPSGVLTEIPIQSADPLRSDLHDMIDGVRIHSRRATAAAKRGDHDLAVREYQLAIDARPDDAAMRLALARFLIGAGHGAEAIEPISQALDREPSNGQAHALLARALLQTGDPERAESQLRQAAQLDPTDRQAWMSLAELLAGSGRLDQALGAYEKAIELDPTDAMSRYRRALALLKGERDAEARKALEADRSVAPDDARLKQLLARLFAASPDQKLRDAVRALKLAGEAIQQGHRAPENSPLHEILAAAVSVDRAETLAMAYAENGRFDRAVAWQDAAATAIDKQFHDKGWTWASDRLALYRARKPCRRSIDKHEHLLSHTYVSPPTDPLVGKN